MNSVFYDMIYERKSFHLFSNIGEALIGDIELENINGW